MNDFKDRVKEKIKEYSKKEYLDGYIKNEFLTDNGTAEIFLNIEDKKVLFDTKTHGNQLDLDEDIYLYIDTKTSMLNNNLPLNLHIIGTKLDIKEESIIKHIINEHYAIELYKVQKEYNRNKNKFFKLIIIGLLFLVSYAIISFSFTSKFFLEVFSFLFSFTLWHAFETIIYTLSDLKIQRESITQKLIMTVDFNDKTVQ